ncbi:MAG TPA: hypothetical protein VNA25_11235 [Phycisphaerae bacterium]|nr:hypothetical protein [Phycisphaerae bacterium]
MPNIDCRFSQQPWKGFSRAYGVVTGYIRHSGCLGVESAKMPVPFLIDTGGALVLLLDMQFVGAITMFGPCQGLPQPAGAYKWAIDWLRTNEYPFVPPEKDLPSLALPMGVETLAGQLSRLYRMDGGVLQLCDAPFAELRDGCASLGHIYAGFSWSFAKKGCPQPYSILGRPALNRIHEMRWVANANYIGMDVVKDCQQCIQ